MASWGLLTPALVAGLTPYNFRALETLRAICCLDKTDVTAEILLQTEKKNTNTAELYSLITFILGIPSSLYKATAYTF